MGSFPGFSRMRRSLRLRLLILFTVLTALTTTLSTWYYVSHEITTYRDQLQREAAFLAEQLAINAKLPLFAEDRGALTHLLAEAEWRFPIRSASITSRDGQVLAVTGAQKPGADSETVSRTASVVSSYSAFTPESVLTGEPPSGPAPVIGTVSVTLETRELRTRIRHDVIASVGVGLIFWLAVSTVGFLVVGRMTRSFAVLMDGAKGIERGNLSTRIAIDSDDEPGRAAQAINRLASSLQKREEENLRLQQERDLALRLEVREEKKRIMARLIQTNKMTSLGLLVSSMAHEINNPNATIGLSAHYLDKVWHDVLPVLKRVAEDEGDFYIGGIPLGDAEQETVSSIEKIHANVQRIRQVVQDLRGYSLGLEGDFASEIDVNSVVASSLTLVRCYQRAGTAATLHTDTEQALPAVIGNARQLEQVVVNLLTNAFQSLPGGAGAVHISTRHDQERGEVVISVRDNGEGIADSVRQRLLEPFVSTRISDGGSGLGLYISNFIVSEHHGRLQFDSEPGTGTRASIFLPIAGQSSRQKPDAAPVQTPPESIS